MWFRIARSTGHELYRSRERLGHIQSNACSVRAVLANASVKSEVWIVWKLKGLHSVLLFILGLCLGQLKVFQFIDCPTILYLGVWKGGDLLAGLFKRLWSSDYIHTWCPVFSWTPKPPLIFIIPEGLMQCKYSPWTWSNNSRNLNSTHNLLVSAMISVIRMNHGHTSVKIPMNSWRDQAPITTWPVSKNTYKSECLRINNLHTDFEDAILSVLPILDDFLEEASNCTG